MCCSNLCPAPDSANLCTQSLTRAKQAPINIYGAVLERVESFKFLGVQITRKLSWFKYTKTVVKRPRQNLFSLRRLKGFGMCPQILNHFYSCTIESILTVCITAWYGNWSLSNRKTLQKVVGTAQNITGAKLSAFRELYNNRQYQRKAYEIVRDSSRSSHRLFSLLPHGKRYQSAKSRTKRLLNSFYPQAMRLLNN